jgi:hypothetical protein
VELLSHSFLISPLYDYVVSFTPWPFYLWARRRIYLSKRRRGGTPEAVWKFWEREKSLASVGIHFIGKMLKVEAFVASYKAVCGGMETRARKLITSLCLVFVFPFIVWCTSLDIRKGNNVNENRSSSTIIMTTQH